MLLFGECCFVSLKRKTAIKLVSSDWFCARLFQFGWLSSANGRSAPCFDTLSLSLSLSRSTAAALWLTASFRVDLYIMKMVSLWRWMIDGSIDQDSNTCELVWSRIRSWARESESARRKPMVCVRYNRVASGSGLVWPIKSCQCDVSLMLSFEFAALWQRDLYPSSLEALLLRAVEQRVCVLRREETSFEAAKFWAT